MTFLEDVRRTATRKLLFLPHAIRQMARPDRMITPQEVEKVVMTGELVEDYPHDSRGHSGLLLGGWRCRPRDPCGVFAENRLFGRDYCVSS